MNFKYYKTELLIPFMLALSILCNSFANWIEKKLLAWQILEKINHLTHTFSTLSLIILIFLFINFIGWKWSIFKWLIDIPNLNGRYTGDLTSSYEEDGKKVKKNCVLEIKQTASSIHVYAYLGDIITNLRTSSSHSVSEQIVKEDNGFFRLYYIFTNETEVLQKELTNHLGTARFWYYPDNKKLEGEYYNQLLNNGTIEVYFKQKKLLARLVK